jgi:hypothetical protein
MHFRTINGLFIIINNRWCQGWKQECASNWCYNANICAFVYTDVLFNLIKFKSIRIENNLDEMPLCYFNKLRDVRLGNSILFKKFLFRFVKIPRGSKNIPRNVNFWECFVHQKLRGRRRDTKSPFPPPSYQNNNHV